MHKSCRRTRLCFATFLIACTLSRITSSQALPSALQSGIPSCAQTCLEDAINEDFVPAVCPTAQDFDCLCSHYGTDGYTLGERAYGCLYSGNCTATSQSNATAVYTICSGENNVVTPTHSTVVVTALTPTSTSGTSAPTSDPSTTAMETTSGQTSSSASSATQAPMISSPTNTATSGPIQLTEAQVAGIAIAAIALVVLTVGIAGCLLFIRRRNKNLEQEEAKLLFHHSRNASGSQTSHLGTPWKDPRGGPGGVGIVPVERSPRPDIPPPLPPPVPLERTWPRYYPIMPGDTFMPGNTATFVPQDGIGVAQTTNVPLQMPASPTAPAIPIPPPEPVMIAPPVANQPRRSFSAAQERPITNYGPPPQVVAGRSTEASTSSPSKRARRSIDPNAVLSQITEFEEDGTSRRSVLHSPTFPHRQSHSVDESRGRPQTRPAVPSLRATSGSPRLQALRPSTLKIQIPTYPTTTASSQPTLIATTQGPLNQSQQFVFPPPPARAPPQSQQPVFGANDFPRPPSLYNKRSSPPNDAQGTHSSVSTVNQLSIRPTNGQTVTGGVSVSRTANMARGRGSKAASKSSRKSQRSVPEPGRDSVASYTSFETMGSDDDPTPPKEEDKELTPPDEGGSPISNLRYPKVPRSTSQAISRTPPSPKKKDSEGKFSPNKISPTPSPRNKSKAASPRGVADQLWRTETRRHDSQPRANTYGVPIYQSQHSVQRPDSSRSTRPQNANTAAAQNIAKPSPQKPTVGESGSWNWSPELNAAFAQFNPKSPFGPMPKLTPTKQGEDLYLSVSRE